MQETHAVLAATAAVAVLAGFAGSATAQSAPTEQEIIDALLPVPGGAEPGVPTRGMRGVRVEVAPEGPPSISLQVHFAYDSAELDNESLLTLNTLGRALASEQLRGQSIEVVGHTDAKGSAEYNDALSQRRAAAVVGYIVRRFALDGSRISSKGMGERQLRDPGRPEAAVNRRVEIRNVTRQP